MPYLTILVCYQARHMHIIIWKNPRRLHKRGWPVRRHKPSLCFVLPFRCQLAVCVISVHSRATELDTELQLNSDAHTQLLIYSALLSLGIFCPWKEIVCYFKRNISSLLTTAIIRLRYYQHSRNTSGTFEFDIQRTVHRDIFLLKKSQQDVLFLKFILVKNSTCFGQNYCPSSGVLILYSQQLVFVMLVMLTVCQRPRQQTVNITSMTVASRQHNYVV